MKASHLIQVGLIAAFAVACQDAPEPLAPDGPAFSKGKSEQTQIGGPFTGPPFWSLLADGLVVGTDEYAIVPLVRALHGTGGEVCAADAPDLTVLTGLAFNCPLTVSGFEHWQDGKWDDGLPWDGMAPRQVHHTGLGAVPILFVDPDQLATAMAGGLSGSELMALNPLIGYADFYKSTNILGLSGPQGIGNGKYTINAQGVLTDGRTFRLLIALSPGVTRQVKLVFGS